MQNRVWSVLRRSVDFVSDTGDAGWQTAGRAVRSTDG
jgi:hypothetical protein